MGFNDDFRFPWKSDWRIKVPLIMALEKILTIDNLRKQPVIVVDRYCMCKKNGETIDHLLHCEVICAI